MLPPLRRAALRARESLDEADEAEAHGQTTPSDRVERSLEPSKLARELAEAVGSTWTQAVNPDLPGEARRWAAPLHALTR
ncbi:MAG: hypothetical protein IT376_06270 [Polyangiaceae bacterium]|nr:hypothetical protein [Polyangiaceae bacterium]